MLFRKQGGRAQQGNLLAVRDGEKRGAQGHFCLAEADIAADQTVHRLARSHVAQNALDGGRLVHGFFKAEALGEQFVIADRKLERVTLARGPLGVEIEQFCRGVAYLLRGLAAGLVPLARAELVKRRCIGIGAAVAGDDMQLGDRDVERAFARVLEMEKLHFPIAHVHVDQAVVAANPVLGMDDRIAIAQLREIADHRLDVAGALACPTPAPYRAVRMPRVEIALGQDDETLGRHCKA